MGSDVCAETIDVDRLIDAAMVATGFEDFGSDDWHEGLRRLVDALTHEAALNAVGVLAAQKELKYLLTARLGIVAYRKTHPQIAQAEVTPPVVIVGQARTGTTILHDLLAQDPAARVPLTWEVERPCPPPESATYETDPRIAAVNARIGAVGAAMPELFGMHPMGAQLGQECVCLTTSAFRSILFATEYRVPSYADWVFDEADHRPAYEWHRTFLQHLQSRHPARRWVLKSPGHIWTLGELNTAYPGALLVQTHRDPLRIIASVTSMYTTLRGTTSNHVDPTEIAREWAERIIDGLNRSVMARRDGTVDPSRVVDIRFADFMRDQVGTVEHVYNELGMPFTDDVHRRATDFLAADQHDRRGGHRYTFAATGLDPQEWRERARPYQEFFDIPSETLD
ncbi:Sulfotransferase family protein [Mycobacterium sp. 88mf]|uniref:Sulfotransferase n=1 Tax=Mycolicibacterium septicum DSM 44393 TaxID=1341646 RepID=A0A7X6MN74_9MYCO|nr:sulfotransferase [Mycolicibacterium septicum]NKZ11284.1 sulfotransferase [Mycolicibacterium septicum DSM 44393]SER83693.1 Sulfotransferase family protein [Mycobacterium sp. 88mf]SFG63950.1 Sulfotransferase family protein [Mycobacterium sp. 455mf]